MKSTILFLVAALALFGCTDADASQSQGSGGGDGDKVNNPWQPVSPDDEVCQVFVPAGFDLEDCPSVTNQAGTTYFCETLVEQTIHCPPEEAESED